jgi:lipopolysaccharide transport protein LptA
MASLHAESLRRGALSFVACLGLGLAASAAQLRQDDSIIVNTGGMKISASNTLELRDGIIITNKQETMMIRAREADAQGVELSFNNSQWEFRGDVHIEVDGAVLDAATATVRFASNRLGSARVVGSPATFSHVLKGATQRNQGRAGTIDYDAGKSLLRLDGGAWYSDGRNEITSPFLVYNLSDRSLEKEAREGERVILTIRPGTSTQTSPSPAPPTAPTTPPAQPPPRGSR